MSAAALARRLRLPAPRHVSLRTRIGVLTAVAAAGAVILVSVVAFFIVRQNILATLDANLLQRATAAARSELVDPQQLAATPTGAFGAGDIRLALLYENGLAQSARGAATPSRRCGRRRTAGRSTGWWPSTRAPGVRW